MERQKTRIVIAKNFIILNLKDSFLPIPFIDFKILQQCLQNILKKNLWETNPFYNPPELPDFLKNKLMKNFPAHHFQKIYFF